MSEETPSPAQPPTPPPPEPPQKSPPAAPKPRRWRRRLIITAVVLLALAMLFRLVMIVALPPVLRHVAAHFGLNATYDKMDLYLLDGDVGIWRFKLTPAQGGESLIESEYARCHVSTLDLLRGRLTIRRLETEGVNMMIERKADGSIPLLDRFIAQASATAAVPAQTALPAAGQPAAVRDIDLTSPLRIDAFRLTNVHAHLRDAAVNPPLDANVDLSIRLTDLNSSNRPTSMEMDVTASPVLDLLHVDGTGVAFGKSMDASLNVRVRGLHPMPAAGYLEPLGIHPTAHYISMQMNAHIKTTASTQPDAVAATLTLDNISAIADGAETAAMDKLTLAADPLGFNSAQVSELSIQGARCQAQRSAHGAFGLGGLELVAAALNSTPAPTPSSSGNAAIASAPPAAPPRIPFAPLHWGLGKLTIQDCRASFHDQSVSPPADVSFHLTDFQVGAISPDAPDAVTSINGTFESPGIVGAIHLDGQAVPFASPATLDLKMAASGICPQALQPYLDAAGLESEYNDGTFTSALHADAARNTDGSLTGNLKLSNIALSDKQELVDLETVNISSAAYDPQTRRIHIKSIDVSGPRISGRREASGAYSVLGFRTKSKPAPPVHAADLQTPAISQTPSTAASGPVVQLPTSLPKLQIDHFTWKNFQLHFDDLKVSPPTSLATGDDGVEVSDLDIDLDPADPPAKPGKLHAWLAIPSVAENISVDGAIGSSGGGASIDLSIVGTGITSEKLAEYFQNSRIQPVLNDGSIHLNAHAAASLASDSLNAELAVTDAVYKDKSGELLAVDAAKIEGLSLKQDQLNIGRIEIKSPRLTAQRDADGSLLAAGFRLTPAPAAPPSDELQSLYRSRATATTTASTASATAPAAASPSFFATLGQFSIEDASVRWADRAVQPAAAAHLVADVDLQNAVLGKSAPPATLKITAREDQALDNLTVAGTLTPASDSLATHLDIHAGGIRAGSLGSYLGPNMSLTLLGGRFHTSLDAEVDKIPAGGMGASLSVKDLDYRETDSSTALCSLDSFHLAASRIDLPNGFAQGGIIAIDDISMTGLEAAATKSPDGKIHAMGLTLGPAAQSVAQSAAAAPPTTKPTSPTTAPAAQPPPATNIKALRITDLAGMSRKKYPLITLANLNINLRRVSFTDQSHPRSAPLAISNLYLWNTSPIEVLGDDPQPGQKIDLQIAGAIDPLVKTMNIHALLWPFAEQPGLTVNLNMDGIRGDGLTDVLPSLKKNIDGSSLQTGRFGAHLGLRLKRDSRDPLNFDLSKGVGLDVFLKAVQFQDHPDGPVLAGIEEVRSENIRMQKSGSVILIKEIDLTNPSARIFRDEAGVHVVGLTIKLPTTAAPKQPTTQPTRPSSRPALVASSAPKPPPALPAAAPVPAPSPGPASKPNGEIRIDKLLLSGLDFNFEDRTCKPPLLVPLNGLDVEVHDLSTLMPYRDKPCRFEAVLSSGIVPPHKRELFSQAEASGIISLYPQPKGWIKISCSALDLAALRGAAKQAGVDLGGGTFDSAIDVRLADGEIDTHSRLVLTDLQLTEPSNGPISRHLKLNIPLDVVIAALQDSDGSITIPIDIPIRSGRIGSGDVAAAALGAFANIMTTAAVNAPLKAADSVLSVFGTDKNKKTPQPPIVLAFDPADQSLSADAVAQLRSLVQQMRDNPNMVVTLRHTIGGGDIERLQILANPTPDDCRNLAYRLRLKKMELLSARDAAAQQVRAQLASGFGSQADESVRNLRDLDRAIATTEDALDHVYDMLRPGADRQAARRTRAACLQIAQDRLDAIRLTLLSAKLPGMDQRIKLAHPTYTAATGDNGGTVTIGITQKKSD